MLCEHLASVVGDLIARVILNKSHAHNGHSNAHTCHMHCALHVCHLKATVDKDEGEGPVLLMDLDSSNGTRMISDTSRVQCSPCEQCVIHAGDVMVSAGVPFKLIRSITSRVVRKRKLSEAGMSDTQTPPHHSSSPSMPSTSSSPSGGTNSAFITCHQPDITSSGSPEF
mmetsp:Transcript_12066/g.19308  ORF Transcript_12066/g.19308 Transcript_12066/m.19308 type:complete len:169 (-) Transcript_12066:98-604(-)